MKLLLMASIAVMALSVSNTAVAQGEVEIEWKEPKKFRDVNPTTQTRKSFLKSTLKELEEYMHSLATTLPLGNKLKMTVTDLDLAGQVWPASFVGLGHGSSDVRIVKNMYIPRIDFSYQLLNSGGEVVQQAEVNLKDMSFLDRSSRLFKNDSLRYEKNMLKRWFDSEFEQQLTTAKKSTDIVAN